MMKNRAGLVALLVLAIAAVVMIFFVLPGRKDAGEMADKAGEVTEAAKDVANDAADKADRVKEALSSPEIMDKVERLKSDAEAAAASLQSLFENGRIPSEDELAEAKAKAEAALKAISDFQAPEGVETAINDVVSRMKENAAKALAAVSSMPDDANSAAGAVAGLKNFFGMSPSDKVAAGSDSETASEAAPATASQLPTFDILRVEKDGSTVIAGKGTPGASVELVDGDKVIATQPIDATGDFAIVLDQPLGAGDHQLVLRVTDKDGNAAVSQEVATVSVPESTNGELLAMVSKPGEASRILTMPQADTKTAETETSAAPASQETAEAAPAAQTEPAADAKTQEAGTSAESDAASQTAQTAPAAATQTQPAEIRVTAVELEGDNIYVAGEALPGAMLKVYADDKPIGDTTADAQGHFVAEGVMPLTVGNHIIRADVIEKTTGKVIVRASVPFNRPEGERVAVAANTDNAASTINSPDGLANSQLTQLREETAKALVLLKGLFADGKTPATDALAAARSATRIALNALASFKPGSDASEQTIASAQKASASAANAVKILDGLKDDPAAVAAAIPSIEQAAAEAIAPVTANAVSENTLQPQPSSASETEGTLKKEASESGATEMAEQNPKTIEQAPLENDSNAVVIRRGDTLWQISRRLYGKGIRYTTIYLANQKEILNPNMINPGQVFKIPEDVLEDDLKAEETNRNFQSR